MYPQHQILILGLVLSGLGYILFHRNRDAKFKRRWWPWYIVGSDLLYVLVLWRLGFKPMFGAILPGMFLVMLTNLAGVKFCDACGRTIMLRNWTGKLAYCPYCGTRVAD